MKHKQISVDELKFGMYVTELDRPWLGTPFLFQGFSITSDDQLEELKKYCRTVYIDLEQGKSGTSPAFNPADSPRQTISSQPLVWGNTQYCEVTPVEKEISIARQVYTACEESIQHSLDSVRSTGELDPHLLTGSVSNMTRSIERNPDAMMMLMRIKQKGDEEFNRAVDTSIHMITFGRFLQFSSGHLELLGLAGLLLDIGKTTLPDSILNKQSKLTEAEFELTKIHVQKSVELINKAGHLPNGLADIVLQHHERLDGSGYPYGLSGLQISINGAMAGIVNSYCALTSKRTFTDQSSPSNALNLLYKQRGILFHDALVEQFIQCIGIYPVGSTVQLNSGEYGIVISQNLVRRLQPRVIIILNAEMQPIRPHVSLDLIKEPRNPQGDVYRIQRTIPSHKLPIDPEEFFLFMES